METDTMLLLLWFRIAERFLLYIDVSGREVYFMDKILFTEYFGIDVPQKQLDFINIYINADKKYWFQE